ncbi:MAG: hypothetical protein GQ562_10435 [Anaerolineales bacterium]|jgi:hypothetical protein|nr:hypothetical protein [Anaerolineales bacterium]
MSLDDIRNQFDDDFDFSEEEVWGEPVVKPELFGMTPVQRFVLAFLLFLTTVLISVFCLIVVGKVALPI